MFKRTLFCFVTERLVQKIGDRLEDIRINLLLCVRMEKNNLHRPVAQRETSDSAVGTGTIADKSVFLAPIIYRTLVGGHLPRQRKK